VLSTKPSSGGRKIAARFTQTPSHLLGIINGLSLACMRLGTSHTVTLTITNYTISPTMHEIFRCRTTPGLSGKRPDDSTVVDLNLFSLYWEIKF